MFTAPSDKIKLSVTETPGYTHVDDLTEDSASLASKLLTINHNLYHTRWNAGFHNHITHHLLTMFSIGASPAELEDMWDYNQPYQMPIDRDHQDVPDGLDLQDATVFKQCLGKDIHYIDFLKYFEAEVEKKGSEAVVREYVLKGDDRSDDIFCRLYTDLVHPMIHLGCAIEWQQPSLVAESLAAACVHENWPKVFLLATEEYLCKNPDLECQPLLQVLKTMQSDPTIANAVKDDDPFNKIADGLMKRVNGEQFARHLSHFRVEPTEEDIQRKLGEMMHTGAYIMGAAQRPGKREKIDFVLLHNVTLSAHYPAIVSQDWLTLEEKARLLEAKGRLDAVMYAACGCPDLYPERIIAYAPKNPKDGWPELFHRAVIYRDEGHAAKLLRALFSLQQHFFELGCDLPIDKQDFIKIAHMAMDSIERSMEPGGTKMPNEVAKNMAENIGHGGEFVVANATRWVFYDGLPRAWDNVPELADDSQPC